MFKPRYQPQTQYYLLTESFWYLHVPQEINIALNNSNFAVDTIFAKATIKVQSHSLLKEEFIHNL